MQEHIWDEVLSPEEEFDALHGNETDPHAPSSLLLQQKKGYVYAKTPAPIVFIPHSEGENKVERTAIRYEPLLDILDQLPDQLRETIAKAWDDKKNN